MTIGTIPHLTDVAVKQQLPTAKHSAFKAPSSPILADSFPGTISTVNTLTSYQTKNTMIPCQDRHPATNSQRLFTCRLQHNGGNIITKSPLTSLFWSSPTLRVFLLRGVISHCVAPGKPSTETIEHTAAGVPWAKDFLPWARPIVRKSREAKQHQNHRQNDQHENHEA